MRRLLRSCFGLGGFWPERKGPIRSDWIVFHSYHHNPTTVHSIRRTLELVEAQYTAPTKIKKANSRANDDARLPVAGGVAGGPGVGVGVSPVPADAKTYQIVVRMLVRAKRLGEAFQLVKSLRRDKGACLFFLGGGDLRVRVAWKGDCDAMILS